MKKLILLMLLLALVLSPAAADAKPKDKPLPLGSRGRGSLCTDHFSARPAKSKAMEELAQAMHTWEYPPFPYEDTFTLHSNPGASHRLYIDCDGHTEYGETYTTWDPDGDGDSFSENEQLLIQKMWYLISEDFMPFIVDVTTEDPGAGFLGLLIGRASWR